MEQWEKLTEAYLTNVPSSSYSGWDRPLPVFGNKLEKEIGFLAGEDPGREIRGNSRWKRK